jgi:hypothetical protein
MTTVAEQLWTRLLAEAWSALDPGYPAAEPAPLAVTGRPGRLPSQLAVEDTAIACAGAALLAAADWRARRGGSRPRTLELDRGHVAAVFRSEAHLRVNGKAAPGSISAPGTGPPGCTRCWMAPTCWCTGTGRVPWTASG